MPQYSDILDELALKLREGQSAQNALLLTEKKNRTLKAENAALYRKIDEATTIILSHEAFIENLTEYNARLLQENRQLQQTLKGAAVPEGQLAFSLDAFWEAITK